MSRPLSHRLLVSFSHFHLTYYNKQEIQLKSPLKLFSHSHFQYETFVENPRELYCIVGIIVYNETLRKREGD